MSGLHAVVLCALLAGVGTIIDACELITARTRNAHAFRWDILQTLTVHRWRRTDMLDIDRVALSTGLQALRVCSAAAVAPALLLAPATPAGPALALACLVFQLLTQNRLVFGLDGADQMLTVIWAALAIYGLSASAAMALIAGQALLAYYAAGLAKLAGAEWRSGAAAGRIVATVTHGSAQVASLLSRPVLNRVATWGTVAFEVGAPSLLLFGAAGSLAFVTMAAAFHGSIAWAMGLNNFVWAFAAALPVLFVTAQNLSLLA